MSTLHFDRKLLQADMRRKELDLAYAQGGKDFADKLAAAREQDAMEFLDTMRWCVSQSADRWKEEAANAMAQKLIEAGYREAGQLFIETLDKRL